ncbi:methyl-accepting chemotaxis protein [Desulfuribacillus alkaliarsenatis]|uniref:Chemotaxis protein n=1 Tax=Desulfuribacillus alkaliarsenatis TaxID=766136 RepID=A0A1E5G654_9FIRM|nr:methyl-accepting chemotaxis protein [Desulfuribacillus alkaliarsenatis]OEF98589.1 hypothetical protein BHF68_02695 [Desulfuribacillus alkaliarsenatis]
MLTKKLSLRLKFMIVIGLCLAVLLNSVFYFLDKRTAQQSEEQLQDITEMMALQILSVRTFLAQNQGKINYDSEGNFEFKGLNPAAGARLFAEEFEKLTGITMKQTSLQYRMPSNAPDDWEREMLHVFEQNPDSDGIFGRGKVNGQEVYRYMLPLKVNESCLTCHGFPVGELDMSGYPKEGYQVGELRGAISVYTPMESHLEFLATNKVFYVTLMLSIIGVLSLIIYILFNVLVKRPLDTFIDGMQKVSNGELNSKIAVNNQDEFGILGTAFNKMVDNLKHLISKVSQSAETVSAYSQEFSKTIVDNKNAMDQISAVAQEQATGIQRQNNYLHDTMATVEQSSASIEEISATIQEVTKSAQRTTTIAKDGNKTMELAMKEIQNMDSSTQEVSNLIHELGLKSEEIGKIVVLINAVAEQTNLLALNAAIEAARAGEHGKGFAVVADEVRKLAEQSQKATKDISSLISIIQEQIQHAVGAVNENRQVVENGNQVIAEGANIFQTIGTYINIVSEQISHVSIATDELAKGSENIVVAINTIEEIARQVAETSSEMTKTTEEQTTAIDNISLSAKNLAKLAHELHEEIKFFKLK